jgi:hypothetical protein
MKHFASNIELNATIASKIIGVCSLGHFCGFSQESHLDCSLQNASVSCFGILCGDTVAASKTERKVFLWRVRSRAKPKEANETVSMGEVLGLLEKEYQQKRARAFVSSDGRILDYGSVACEEKSQVYVADISKSDDGKTITILFNRGDPSATAPAFIDAANESVRIMNPKAGEAVGYSAHLVISLDETGNSHRACFEKMPLVSTSLVLEALDKILARAVHGDSQYTYIKRKKKGKEVLEEEHPYFPALEINRVPSENLLNDITQGQLSEIRLTKRVEFYSGPGADNLVTRQEQIVKISATPGTVEQVKSFISSVIRQAKDEKFETITFGLEKLPGGQTNHPTIPLDVSDAMETLYVRAQRITDFEFLLEGCYSSVCTEIETKMIGVLKAKSVGW